MQCLLVTILTVVTVTLAATRTEWPTSRPAVVDLSSPDAAIKSFADALEQGDLGAYEKICAPQTEDERRVLYEGTLMGLAAQRLLSTTQERLGDDATAAVEEMTGRIGLGASKESAESLREARQESQWKIALAGLMPFATTDATPQPATGPARP